MKELTLNTGKTTSQIYCKYKALVDDADYEHLTQFYWYAKRNGYTVYARGIVAINGEQREVYLHRYLMGVVDNRSAEVDHKDHNGLNNQRDNLRACTKLNNSKNRRRLKVPTMCSKQYKGVTKFRNKKSNRFIARIRIDGQLLAIGNFETEVEAAMAYNEAASKAFGEFACLNDLDMRQLGELILRKKGDLEKLTAVLEATEKKKKYKMSL